MSIGRENYQRSIIPILSDTSRFSGRTVGEAEAIILALSERAPLIGIGDKNGINACKLLRIPFTTAIGILIRMLEKKLLRKEQALAKLAMLGKQGRYKQSILEDAKRRLEVGT